MGSSLLFDASFQMEEMTFDDGTAHDWLVALAPRLVSAWFPEVGHLWVSPLLNGGR
jgi:hypothetical protein